MEKGLIRSSQGALFGKPEVIGYTNGVISVKEIDRELANNIIKENHYSHKVYNATYIHLGVFIGGGARRSVTIWLCDEPCELWQCC